MSYIVLHNFFYSLFAVVADAAVLALCEDQQKLNGQQLRRLFFSLAVELTEIGAVSLLAVDSSELFFLRFFSSTV